METGISGTGDLSVASFALVQKGGSYAMCAARDLERAVFADLGRLTILAAFGAASHLHQISGSGFENVWLGISQCESPRSSLGAKR
jgi:hypothetical protein